MARKFDVIEADGQRGPQVKKSVAFLLIRRLVAVREPGKPFTIRKLALHEQPSILPRDVVRRFRPRRRPLNHSYQHHIEPRINRFTITSSEWLRYLHGYQQAK